MAHLIIGHTTETTARIWVRGDKACTCRVTVCPTANPVSSLELSEEADFTCAVDVTGLTAGTVYFVEASFSSHPEQKVSGSFQAFPKQPQHQPSSFSFVLSSCNLSVVSINNFLARLLATAGAMTALTSLELPLRRWRAPRFIWLRWLLRWPLKKLLEVAAGGILGATAIKQPGPPYIRSPFLKLSAIFDSWVLDVDGVKSPPTVGERIYVPGPRGASGVVACSPTEKKEGPTDSEGKTKRYKIVLTAVKGSFKANDCLFKQAQMASEGEKKPPSYSLGTITETRRGKKWYTPPSFFLHAGDQIYYDFPDVDREPKMSQYRLAYREAWFYDIANRHLLSHWPQYMTLDDHEIADQFAQDFNPPKTSTPATCFKRATDFEPETYLSEATVAYREYVQAISPQVNDADTARKKDESYWYRFDKGAARFFVLDTRTQRFNKKSPAQMIDKDQMRHLLDWMTRYRNDLKFVVTSVPFVAEISDDRDGRAPRWSQGAAPRQQSTVQAEASGPAAPPRNDENDKWSAKRFKEQREQIIEHISRNNIQRLIFLTGDMHCCYHASMQIATRATVPITTEPRQESIIVHELAGGPVNQLQLANVAEFDRRCTGRTAGGFAYETVLDRFHSQVNAVMHLKVEYVEREQTTTPGRAFTPEVEWNVIRTLTDNEAADWPVEGDPKHPAVWSPESVMNGRICFVETRKTNALPRWSDDHAGQRVRR